MNHADVAVFGKVAERQIIELLGLDPDRILAGGMDLRLKHGNPAILTVEFLLTNDEVAAIVQAQSPARSEYVTCKS